MKFTLTVLALATAAVAVEVLPRDYDYAHKGNGTVYKTITVNELVTYCPGPTHVTQHGKTYTVTKAGHLTITDCPCTIIEPVLQPKTILYTSCESDEEHKKEHKETYTKEHKETKTYDEHKKETKIIDTYTKTYDYKTHADEGYKHHATGAPVHDDKKKDDKDYKQYTGAADSVRVGGGLFAGVLAVLGLVL